MIRRTRSWPVTLTAGVAVGAAAAVLGAAAGLAVGAAVHRLPPLSLLARVLIAAHLPLGLTRLMGLPWPPSAAAWLHRWASAWPVWAAAGAALAGLPVGSLIGWLAGAASDNTAERGRSVSTGHRAAKTEASGEHRVSGKGIHIHPKLTISRDRETRGIMLTGSIGAGKTVIIQHLLTDLLHPTAAAARVLIHDFKGDFTSSLPSGCGLGLIAPWDARSLVWSAAEDIRSAADARELAERLVPQPKDGNPMWAQGAAMILGGLIVTLSRASHGQWGWADLQQMIAQPYPAMRQAALAGAPMASGLLPDEPTATTTSYISNLTAAAGGLLSDLAAAEKTDRPRWSVRRWLLGEGPRVVILQNSTRFSSLARALHGAVIRSLSGALDSLPDSRERRIWLVMDEFPQLGHVHFSPLIETGRSKGICCVLGIQDISQIRDIYGADVAASWASMIGTHVVTRVQGPETQRWAADLLGKRQVRRHLSSASGDALTGSGRSMAAARNVTVSEQIADEDVVRPEEFAALGPGNDGVTAFLITGGRAAHRLTWPWPSKKIWHARRRPLSPAAWTESLMALAAPAEPADPAPAPAAARTAAAAEPQQQVEQAPAEPAASEQTPADEVPPTVAVTPSSAPAPALADDDDADDGEEFVEDLAEDAAEELADHLAGEIAGDALAGLGTFARLADALSLPPADSQPVAVPATASNAEEDGPAARLRALRRRAQQHAHEE